MHQRKFINEQLCKVHGGGRRWIVAGTGVFVKFSLFFREVMPSLAQEWHIVWC